MTSILEKIKDYYNMFPVGDIFKSYDLKLIEYISDLLGIAETRISYVLNKLENIQAISSVRFSSLEIDLDIIKESCMRLEKVVSNSKYNELVGGTQRACVRVIKSHQRLVNLLDVIEQKEDNDRDIDEYVAVDNDGGIQKRFEYAIAHRYLDDLNILIEEYKQTAIDLEPLSNIVDEILSDTPFLDSRGWFRIWILLAVFVCCFAAVLIWFEPDSIFLDARQKQPISNVVNYIKKCQERFPHQNEDTWSNLIAGITAISKSDTVATYLLLHNRNYRVVDCMRDIIFNSAKNYTPQYTAHPFILDGSVDYPYEKMGQFLDYAKMILPNKNVFVVENFEYTSIERAKAFHYICDEHNPLIKRSVIVLMLHTEEKLDIHNVVNVAEVSLKKIWPEMDDYYLQPLITRLTTYPMIINREPFFTSRC